MPVLGVVLGGVSFGFAGFAFAVFSSAALSLVSPPRIVVPAVMLAGDTLALLLLWGSRGHVRRTLFGDVFPSPSRVIAFLLVGVVAGTIMLGRVSANVGRVSLALIVLGFVVFQLLRSSRGRTVPEASTRPVPAWTASVAGLIGGFLDGWLGTGGVVIAMYLTWRRVAAATFLPVITLYFLTSDTLRVVNYALAGYWTAEVFALYLRVVPLAVAGYLIGVLLRRWIPSTAAFRAVVLTLLGGYGVALLWRGLLAK